LIKIGANIDLVTKKSRSSALLLAAGRGYEKTVQVLIHCGASLSIKKPDHQTSQEMRAIEQFRLASQEIERPPFELLIRNLKVSSECAPSSPPYDDPSPDHFSEEQDDVDDSIEGRKPSSPAKFDLKAPPTIEVDIASNDFFEFAI